MSGAWPPPSPSLPALIYHVQLVHRSLDGSLATGVIEPALRVVLDVIDLLEAGSSLSLAGQGIALLAPDFGHFPVQRSGSVGTSEEECQRARKDDSLSDRQDGDHATRFSAGDVESDRARGPIIPSP